MLEAEFTRLVVMPEKGKTVFMAVVEYYGEAVNVKVPYDWETINVEGFLSDLREKLAEDFDIETKQVAIPEKQIVEAMRYWHHKFKAMVVH